MQNKIMIFLKKIPWQIFFVGIFAIVMEFSIHPLTFGPDRWIHDPAVYRINNPSYLPGDYYTEMAAGSGVYEFYAPLIKMSDSLNISEERWRQVLYLGSLVLIYTSIFFIGRIFSRDWLVLPLLVSLHAYIMTLAPPFWLYGKFIQVDGGLAPRSIGVALSFLALYFLLKNYRFLPWALLGLATLIHVSNSFIIFTLFLVAYFFREILYRKKWDWSFTGLLLKNGLFAGVVYTLSGGWFIFNAAIHNMVAATFSDQKFIWTWIFFRAPYMALKRVPFEFWAIFWAHILIGGVCWYLLRKKYSFEVKRSLDLLAIIGVVSVLYLFLFYLFSITFPWLPGFQFYSLRVIYFAYFIAYLFLALGVVGFYQEIFDYCVRKWRTALGKLVIVGCIILSILVFKAFFVLGSELAQKTPQNLAATWERLKAPEKLPEQMPTIQYLYDHSEPFLSPVADWSLPPGSPYLPSIVTVKCFGFTKPGLEEWFERINAISGGELQKKYEKQLEKKKYKAVTFDWIEIYKDLSAEDIKRLSQEYKFNLVLAYRDTEYPFEVVEEDDHWRLYRLEGE